MKKRVLAFLICLALLGTGFVTPAQVWGENRGLDISRLENPDIHNRITSIEQTVFVRNYAVYVLKNDNSLWAWGSNTYGDIANGYWFEPTFSYENGKWKDIHPFVDTPCKVLDNVMVFDGSGTWAIKNDYSLWVWGDTAVELGVAEKAGTATPQKYMDNVISFSMNYNIDVEFIAYALLRDGTLVGWGNNTYGELGDGTKQKHTSPVTLMRDVKAIQYAYTRDYASEALNRNLNYLPGCCFAIKKDNSLWVWGYVGSEKGRGLSGVPCGNLISTPVKVMDNVSQICNGEGTVAVLTQDRKLYVWGEIPVDREGARSYRRGLIISGADSENMVTYYYSEAPFLLAENVKEVSVNYWNINYLTTDGSAYIWGKEWANTRSVSYALPTKIMDDVSSIASDHDGMLALKTNGGLMDVGGFSGNATSDSPRQLLSGVKGFVMGRYMDAFAVKSDGSVWGAGNTMDDVYQHYYMGKRGEAIAPQSSCEVLKLTDGAKVPSAPAAPATDEDYGIFKDVPKGAWYEKYLKKAYDAGIVGGTSYDHYSPSGNLTHGQIMVMAANLHSLQKGDGFKVESVSGDHWAAAFRDYCKQEGIIDGRFDGRLDQPVTRGEMAYYFANTLSADSYQNKKEVSLSDISGNDYEEEISRLAKADIVGGYDDGTFRADAPVTRAEAAVFISNILDAME